MSSAPERCAASGRFGGNPSAEAAGFAAIGFEPAQFFMILTGCLQLAAGLPPILGLGPLAWLLPLQRCC
jgi:uncharacterized membrane protein YphA (DoxX/SURF4 family)